MLNGNSVFVFLFSRILVKIFVAGRLEWRRPISTRRDPTPSSSWFWDEADLDNSCTANFL